MKDAAARPAVRVRLAEPADADALLGIYAPIVERTHISFELETPNTAEMARRIRSHGAFAPYLVCEEIDGEESRTLGYAYAAPFRMRPAYRFSAETSVYIAEAARRRGVATALYRALLAALGMQGFVAVIAGIALPNRESVALHERLGFTRVALLPAVGFKRGRWHDVGYWSLRLREPPSEPGEPLPPSRLEKLDEVLVDASLAVRFAT